MRAVHDISNPEARAKFPAGTVLHNPVTREYARIVEHTPERVVGELLAAPGSAVAGPHRHPGQEERFEVLEGTMGYRRGDVRAQLRPGESVTVPAGVVPRSVERGKRDPLAEAFGDEIVFERPPRAVQRALAATVAPLARRRGRSVTGEDVVRAALVPSERWPLPLAYRLGGQAVA